MPLTVYDGYRVGWAILERNPTIEADEFAECLARESRDNRPEGDDRTVVVYYGKRDRTPAKLLDILRADIVDRRARIGGRVRVARGD
jgi:hypothetical protein